MPVKTGLAEKRKIYLKKNLEKLLPRFEKLNPEKVILFGSLAKGNIHKESDIDLIIIVKDIPSKFLQRLEKVYNILDPDFSVDILVYTPEEIEKMKEKNPFIKKALEEGIVLYERKS
ncbi:MAG: nucleotidyltransferase domain-containing protein [Thermodesulfobacterium geofontis]|uniref:Nucleotidyltransferase domain-containing protein n=1 Tax=Thermodesulfobacterium geofontis TaxID=1295609 RepID=A0A2N7PN54_9BACT|nr:MAG: nucleotidyltransferase domain-containing protein [Thermodesulfobacterium geofontis]